MPLYQRLFSFAQGPRQSEEEESAKKAAESLCIKPKPKKRVVIRDKAFERTRNNNTESTKQSKKEGTSKETKKPPKPRKKKVKRGETSPLNKAIPNEKEIRLHGRIFGKFLIQELTG